MSRPAVILAAALLLGAGPTLAAGPAAKPRLSVPPPKVQTLKRDAVNPQPAPDQGCPAMSANGPAGKGPGGPVPADPRGPGAASQDSGASAEWRPPPIPPLRDATCGQAASADGQGQAEWRPPPIPPLK